jgi:hypothetical protein
MRRGLAIAFLALALAGCDVQVSVAPSASPTTSPAEYSSATPSPLSASTPAPTPLLPASPSRSPLPPSTPFPSSIAGAPAYGVLVDLTAAAATYDIALVGADGSIPTTVHAARRTAVETSAGHPVDLPYVSTSLTSLYYLDGDAQVRAVRPGGAVRAITTLDAGRLRWATFAVSPDDTRIAVSVLDFSRQPVHVLLYTENLDGTGHKVIYESDSNYVWPVAWHGGLLVLAHTIGPFVEDGKRVGPGRMNPYWAASYHVVNPQTADRVQLLGQCTVSGPLGRLGSACIQGGTIDWSGTDMNWGTSNWGSVSSAAAISPDGSLVAATVPGQPTRLAFWRPDNTFSISVEGPPGYYWAGWIDEIHVLVGNSTDPTSQARVITLANGTATALAVKAGGFFAARLPTDVS